jgi:hypothetical protein
MKYFSIKAILLLCLLLPLCSQAVPMDWKTLNNKYGWTIQYPGDWMLDEDFASHQDFRMSPSGIHDGNSKDAYAPEICGPAKAMKIGEQAGCIFIRSASTKHPPSSRPLEKIMKGMLDQSKGFQGHETKIQGLPAYDAIGYLQGASVPFPMRKVLVRTTRGTVDVFYYEMKDTFENYCPESEWKHEKTFEAMLSTLKFNH